MVLRKKLVFHGQETPTQRESSVTQFMACITNYVLQQCYQNGQICSSQQLDENFGARDGKSNLLAVDLLFQVAVD